MNTGSSLGYTDVQLFILKTESVRQHTGYIAVASLDKFCISANVRPIGGRLLAPPKPPLPPLPPPRPPLPPPRDIGNNDDKERQGKRRITVFVCAISLSQSTRCVFKLRLLHKRSHHSRVSVQPSFFPPSPTHL